MVAILLVVVVCLHYRTHAYDVATSTRFGRVQRNLCARVWAVVDVQETIDHAHLLITMPRNHMRAS